MIFPNMHFSCYRSCHCFIGVEDIDMDAYIVLPEGGWTKGKKSRWEEKDKAQGNGATKIEVYLSQTGAYIIQFSTLVPTRGGKVVNGGNDENVWVRRKEKPKQ